MLIEEVKKFELLLNAGRFKYELKQAGFQLVLHGHKHDPAVFLDTTVPKGGSLLVVSGGTIGGAEGSGSGAGFHLIDLKPPSSVDIRYVRLPIVGDPKVAIEDAKIISHSLPMDDIINTWKSIPHFDLDRNFAKISRSLGGFLRKQEIAERTLIGWSHEVEDRVATAIATAFGLRILSLCHVNEPATRLQVGSIVKSLWSMQQDDRCWSANFDGGGGRLEATAWVLLGLWEWPSTEPLFQAIIAFEKMLNSEPGLICLTHPSPWHWRLIL